MSLERSARWKRYGERLISSWAHALRLHAQCHVFGDAVRLTQRFGVLLEPNQRTPALSLLHPHRKT